MRGDITLKPLWGTSGQKLINYNLYNATASEYGRFLSEPTYVFTPETAFTLPGLTTVEDPSGNNISSWQIDGVDVTEIPSTATSDVEVKAVFNDTGTYRIEFDMGEGHLTITPPSEYTSGVELPLPASTSVVAPNGREFSHWMLRGANGNIINPNTATISNTQRGYVKVVAVYNILSYKITWDLGSGRFISSFATPSQYKYGVGLTLPASTSIIAPLGHEFNHWEIGGIATTSIPVGSIGDKEFNAKYRNETYSVTWHDSDGNAIVWASGFTATMSYAYSEGMALPATESIVMPLRMELDYWIIRRAGKPDIEHATSTLPTLTGDVDMIAVYKYVTYTINYDTVITDADIDHNSVERTYNSADTELSIPSKTNYRFVGWYTNYNATTHEYTNAYTCNDDIYIDGINNYTIYAKWQAKIIYNTNGHGSMSPNYLDVDLYDSITLATLSDVAGYTFDLAYSWYDGADTSTSTLIGSAGSNYTVTEPKELYAKWTENSYKVILHVNDGIFNAGYTNFTLNTSTGNYEANRLYHESITLPRNVDISKNNFRFDGWYDNASLTGIRYVNVAANTPNVKEFWLKWTNSGGDRLSGGGGNSGSSGGGGAGRTIPSD